jgi:hypothetical protein
MQKLNEMICSYISDRITMASKHYEDGNLELAEFLSNQARDMAEAADNPYYYFLYTYSTK